MASLIPFNKKRNDLMNLGFNDFSNMLDDFFSANGLPFERSLRHDTFKVDIKDEEDKYVIEAEVPGVKKEDIQVTIDDGRLNLSVKHESVSEEEGSKYIHRERRMSQMSRSILLKDVSEEGAQAKLEDGVLKLIFPKKENVETSKRIMIE